MSRVRNIIKTYPCFSEEAIKAADKAAEEASSSYHHSKGASGHRGPRSTSSVPHHHHPNRHLRCKDAETVLDGDGGGFTLVEKNKKRTTTRVAPLPQHRRRGGLVNSSVKSTCGNHGGKGGHSQGDTRWEKLHQNQHANKTQITRSDDAKIIGILNRLNTANYDRLFVQAVSLLLSEDDTGWNRVIDIAVYKCCSQPFYLDLYKRFIGDVIRVAGVERGRHSAERLGGRLRDFVANFVYVTIPGIERMMATSDHSVEDEDAFCAAVKSKAHVIGTNRTVIRLMNDGNLMRNYVWALKEGIETASCERHLDVLLDFLIELVVVRGHPSTSASDLKGGCYYEKLSDDIQKCVEVACSITSPTPKCRFKLMDVREAAKILG